VPCLMDQHLAFLPKAEHDFEVGPSRFKSVVIMTNRGHGLSRLANLHAERSFSSFFCDAILCIFFSLVNNV
jgi:hypothetical protein